MRILFLLLMIQTIPMMQASELSKRVESLEVDRALNIFNFSGRLDTQYFKLLNPQNDKLDLYRLRSSLNVNADISSNIKFYSRYTMSKYFNTYTQENISISPGRSGDIVASSSFQNPGLFVQRAYFDYFLKIPLTISLGRLPTFGGEPLNFYDNLPPQSTYPLMAYNAELDGIALTYDFYKMIPKNHQSFLRMIYTPLSHVNYNNTYFPLFLPSGVDGGKMTSNTVATLAMEYSIMNQKAVLDEWRLKIFYSRLHGITFNDVILPSLPQAGVFNTTPVIQFPNKMLNINFFSIHNKFTNLAKIGLDLHASFLLSSVENRKLALISLPAAVSLGFRQNDLGTVTGTSFLITLKKKLPFSFLNRPSIGLEYFKGEDTFLSPTALGSAEDLSGFYSTLGNAWHFFYLQPLEDQLSVRFGYRIQNIDYRHEAETRYGLGSAEAADQNIKSYYLNLLLYF